MSNVVLSEESFTYDAAGNITDAPDSCFQYDTNNRLVVFNGNSVSYDMDGNMLNNGVKSFTYDSANRLISAGGHTYTYNAEDVRIRNLCTDEDTTYTYDTNCRLSKLLCKTTNNVTTKYVYGRGLIGEEVNNAFKTYHFDSRGSTIAITNTSGSITDTFVYDTYGKLISRTGTSKVIFGYNGRDGVVTEKNGLIYMRARYYSPEMRRFINSDIVPGKIAEAVTLNRYAYANANPVMFIDPRGLSSCPFGPCKSCLGEDTYYAWMAGEITLEEIRGGGNKNIGKSNVGGTVSAGIDDTNGQVINKNEYYGITNNTTNKPQPTEKAIDYEEKIINEKNNNSAYDMVDKSMDTAGYVWELLSPTVRNTLEKAILNSPRPKNFANNTWTKYINEEIATLNNVFKYTGYGMTTVFTVIGVGMNIEENIKNGKSTGEIISDVGIEVVGLGWSTAWGVIGAKTGATIGTFISPGLGTVIGGTVGAILAVGMEFLYEYKFAPTFDNYFEYN